MMRSIKLLGVATLAAAISLSCAANAQTVHRHVRHHPVAEGHRIIVHARESWLTAGPGAFRGTYNSYALDTVTPGIAQFEPNLDHTFVGVRGLNRLPNNFTVPGCCVP